MRSLIFHARKWTARVSACCFVAFGALALAAAPAQAQATNVALNKPVTAETDIISGAPENIVDGSYSTWWYSYQGSTSSISFVVDLKRVVTVEAYRLQPLQTESYTIYTSLDGTTWTQRYVETDWQAWPDNRLRNIAVASPYYQARYIRYVGGNNQNAYVGMLEFEVHAQAFNLNDTGQTACYNNSTSADCATVAADGGTHPRQDARFGRDVAGMARTGAGAAGFDFTALDASGAATTPGAHVCVKDNHTNLIWSTETFSATWSAAATTASTYSRCGFAAGWRVPTRRELLSIVHHGASNPAIDATYFPATQPDWYWTSDTYAPNPVGAWHVSFNYGSAQTAYKTDTLHVRLVRSGQLYDDRD